jgi:TPR repeat protein
MKKYLMLFCMAVTFIAQTCFAQDENRIKEIAFDYLLQNIESISARPWSVFASSCDKMSSGEYVVNMIITRTLTEKREELVPNQVHAYGATFNVGVREATVSRDYEQTKYFLVFIDSNGEPCKYMTGARNHIFKNWKGNAWLIMNKHEYEDGKKVLPYYGKISCFSNKGETLLSIDDMRIYDWKYSGNTLYIVGKMGINDRSVVRAVDVKTFEYDEKLGGTDVLPYNIAFEGEGVKITQKTENGGSSSFMFPYASNDKEYQRSLVMKKYDKNNALDQIAIGDRYFNGNIFEKNEKNAFDWYMKAANQNNSQGLYKVAYCYQNGLGVGQDKAKAVEHYEKAANANNDDAISAVTKMYVNGDGIPKNMSRALYWQERLAFKNNKEAQQFVIANQSIEHERYELSPSSLREAAINNHKATNYKWAEFCIKRAIELGDEKAKLHYGLWLGSGDGVDKDYTMAEQYLTPFAENGDKDAAAVLGQMWGNLNDKKKQMYWVEKAAISGDLNSQLILADAYQNGIGVKKDKKKAFAMYKMAAELGNQDAIKEVVYSYITGKGVKKDGAEGIDWYKKLNLENQLSVAKDFEENPKIKVDIAVVIVMYQIAAEKKNYGAMKKYAEFAVKYLPEKKAIDALNLLDDADVDYTIKKSDGYMLWGQLHESYGRIGQAIECYKNSGTPKGRERAEMLNRRR